MNYQALLQKALTWGQSKLLYMSFPAEFQPLIYWSDLLSLKVHEIQLLLRTPE